MNTRPVLSMNFYEAKPGQFVNPYQNMIVQAQKQKQTVKHTRIETINTTFHNIEEVIDNFLPEESAPPSVRQERKRTSGPNKYKKEYFEHLDNNLKLINSYLEVLEKQV